jgi:hypothetical protein
VASLGASAIFLVLRNDQTKKLEAQCSEANRAVCPDMPAARSLQNQAANYNRLANIALGVGGAAVVGGAVWYFLDKTRSSGIPASAKLHVVPTDGGATFVIAGAL